MSKTPTSLHALIAELKRRGRIKLPPMAEVEWRVEIVRDGLVWLTRENAMEPKPTEAERGFFADGTETIEWFHRDTPTPADVDKLWATDGERVWLIWNFEPGKPISPHATRVKAWGRACIPAPPAQLPYRNETKHFIDQAKVTMYGRRPFCCAEQMEYDVTSRLYECRRCGHKYVSARAGLRNDQADALAYAARVATGPKTAQAAVNAAIAEGPEAVKQLRSAVDREAREREVIEFLKATPAEQEAWDKARPAFEQAMAIAGRCERDEDFPVEEAKAIADRELAARVHGNDFAPVRSVAEAERQYGMPLGTLVALAKGQCSKCRIPMRSMDAEWLCPGCFERVPKLKT